MHKFKIGDTVVRTHGGSDGLPVGETGTVTHIASNGWPLVEGYGNWMHDPSTLSLVQDELPLPPAPESVWYFNSERDADNDQRLIVRRCKVYDNTIQLGIIPRGLSLITASIGLDADAALQLCHDLRRMAMELKRKEKQDA